MGAGPPLSRDSRRPRRRGAAALAVAAAAIAIAACGGGGTHFRDRPRPPVPVDLSVYIDNSHVSISPTRVGAGPLILYVTNQASSSQDVAIRNARGGSVASSGHINSGSTAQVSTTLATGTYEVATGARISPAQLEISQARKNADNVLLQP